MLRAINATSSHPSEEHHNFVDAPNAAKASDSDDRWARAEHKWLEIFFSTEEGGMTSTVKGVDSLGRPLLELERVIKVSFNEAADRLSNITGGSNGRAGSGVRRQDDVLRKTQGGKGRIVRPRTADLSKQQRKMLEEFRVLDQYIFIREDDPRVIDDSSTRIRKETSISTYDASPPNDDQPSADLAATASQSEIILPKHARPLSREGREILREVVTSASRASSTLSKALVDQSLSAARSTLKASKPDLAPSADSDHHETALPGLPSPTIKAKLPPSMSQRHVPEDYVDLPQKNVRTRNITNRFKIPRVPHLPRLTPASSRMVVSMGESNRDVRQMSWGVKLETPVKADHSIEEEFPMDDSLLAGSNASRSLTSSLECIEDTMSAFGVPYEDRRLMQLRALSTYLTTQHDQSHRATRRIGHIFPLDYFMDFEETLHLLRNIHLPSFRARNIHHHDSADFIWDSPSSSSSLSSWRPCKVVQFDPVQKLFEIEFEGSRGSVRAHSIWVTKCDVLPPWESEEGMRRKLVTAQVMRAEFEYFVTLREWVAIARPQLEKLVPEFPSGYVEGLLKKVIASRSWRGVSGLCSHDDGFGEEEDGPTAFADCSIELAELRNHYFDSQVRATLIQISAFREHVPLSVIFDSYHQMFRKSRYLESVQEGSGTGFTNQGTAAFSVSHLVKEVGGELIFLKRPVADVLAWVKEELGKCLGPTVYESFAQPLSDSHRQQTERQCSMLLTSAQSKSGNELGDLRTSRLRSSAAPRRESMLNLLSSEDLDKSGAVVAEMDEDGVVHVSPSDFQKYSKAFQTRFVTSVGSAAAEIIGRGWQDIKDSLRGGGDHGGEETYGSRLSRMVSTLAESYALPFLRHRIMETYQLFKEGKLVILLNLVVQSSATEEGNAITPLTIDYDTPLTQVSEHVLDALTRWLDPVECILPDGIMTSTPADHRYIETLCKDLISDAASAASDFLTEIRKSLIPRIRSASRPLISNGSSESYLGVCKAVMRDLDQIGGGLGRLPGRMKRGVFEIRTEVMRGMIEGWVEKARKSTLRVIAKRVRDELGKLKGADWFFGLVLPGTFDETKVAISVLGELRAEIPKLEQQSGLTKALKAFLNDCLYSLDDDTVAQFYGTYTLHSRLAEFLATSETEVSNTVSRLRVTLDREVNMFVGVQREVESKLRKLLEDPIVADVIVKPANAQRARLSGIKTHITDAIEIGRAIQQKADCIQDGVIKGRLATIDAELNDWLVLVNGVVDMYENVCGWRNNPISGLDMSKVIERSSELQNVMQSTVLRSCAVVKRADEELTHFIINQLPVLRIVTDRGLRSWHWERIVQILGLPADTDQDTVSLAELLVNARQLQDVLSALRVVAEEGDKELSLRGTIETVSERFDTLQLALHEDSDIPFPAITSFDAAISSLESDQLTLSMLNSSPFSQRYASSISRVKGELNTALEILKQWSILQPLMQKVHSFFVTDQVRLQLAAELKRYRGIEGSYRAVMVRFVRSGRAIRKFTVSTDGMLHMLEGMNSKLQRIVEDFQSWLDNKRHTFPRLFCLADDELLDLVSNATKPDEVSLCLTKLFRIRRLIHKKDASAEGDFRILGIESPEGEKLHFRNPISTKSYTVEVWMTRLNGEIQSSLKEMVLSNLRETSKGLKSSVWERDIRNVIDSSALGQVKILLIQILTTATLEGLIQTSASDLQQMREKVQNSVELLGELLRNRSGNGISQLAWGALISVLIGYRDWVAQLAEEKVQSLDEFAWMAGLRYRHDEEELAVTVEQSMYSAQYGFDYLGPDLALPTLPLHSAFAKVWLANHSRYGVVAIGEHPGKTHFLRMHLTSLGRYAIEFSLNKNIMPAAVARLLIGAALGVSIVFRHVDRLNAESFSTWVSGMESMRYLTGRQDLTVGSFLGRAVKLTPTDCLNCFATLSRATEGSVSADTIEKVRSHNRVLSISPPDLVAISVGIFERYGLHSSDLGLKLGTFFKMGPTLLHHIDFTLRGLKAVFTIFQKLRETETEKSEPEALTAAIDVLIRGQLATNDIIIFDTLIKKVFGVANSDGPAGHLQAERSALRTAVDGGQHIVMVEKHRGAALKIIQNCAEERGANVHFINTTAIEGALLLGQQTAAGSINGVIANVISSHLKSDNAQTWLVFEAVDSEMEDYLYDLGAGDAGMCLVTGRRIVLPQKCTIIIQASESLSRMSDNFSTIRVREIWSWRAELMEWEVKIFGGKASTENQSQVCSTIANLSSMLFSEMWRLWGAHAVIDERTSYKGLLKILYCNLQEGGLQRYCASSAFILEAFISALIWTVGNALPPLARVDFQEQLIRWLESNVRICGFLSAWKQTLKSGGSIFDLRFDVLLAKWCPASSAASNPAAIRNGILNLLLSHGISVCAIGDVNIGKRDTVLGLLSSNSSALVTHFLGRGESLKAVLQQNLFETAAGLCAPIKDKKLVIFMEEANATAAEAFKLLHTEGGYWCNSGTFRKVRGVSAVVAVDVCLKERKWHTPFEDGDFMLMCFWANDFWGDEVATFVKRLPSTGTADQILAAAEATSSVRQQLQLMDHGNIGRNTLAKRLLQLLRELLLLGETDAGLSRAKLANVWLTELSNDFSSIFGDDLIWRNLWEWCRRSFNVSSKYVETNRQTSPELLRPVRVRNLPEVLESQPKFMSPVTRAAPFKKIVERMRVNFSLSGRHSVLNVPSDIDGCHSDEVVHSAASLEGCNVVEYCADDDPTAIEWSVCLRKLILSVAGTNRRSVLYLKLCKIPLAPACCMDLKLMLQSSLMMHLWRSSELDDILRNGKNQQQSASQLGALHQLGKDAGLKITLLLVVSPDSINVHGHYLADIRPRLVTYELPSLSQGLLKEIAQVRLRSVAMVVDVHSLSELVAEVFLVTVNTNAKAAGQFPVSSANFVEFLETFIRILETRTSALQNEAKDVQAALDNIQGAENLMLKRCEEAQKQMTDLPDILRKLDDENTALIEERNNVLKSIEKCQQDIRDAERNANIRKREMEADLVRRSMEAAKTAYDGSLERLQSIGKDDIEELKSFSIPPPTVELLGVALCLVFDRKTTWAEGKKLISSHSFLARMAMLEPKSLASSKVQRLQKMLESPVVQPDRLYSALDSVRTMFAWLRATCQYATEHLSSRAGTIKRVESSDPTVRDKLELELEGLIQRHRNVSDRLSDVTDRLNRETGHLALLREIFNASNIFGPDDDPEGEAQWIQQAFHSTERNVLFETEKVALAHDKYQLVLNQLADLQESLAEERNETDKLLDNALDLIRSLTPSNLFELVRESEQNQFSNHAWRSLQKVFNLSSTGVESTFSDIRQKLRSEDLAVVSQNKAKALKTIVLDPLFQQAAFYDRNMAATSAVKPVEGCKAAFVVREVTLLLHTFNGRRERLETAVAEARHKVADAKSTFDARWIERFGDVYAFWTFERIIAACRQVPERLKRINRKSLLADLSATTIHPLLSRVLQAVCALIGWESESTALRKRVLANSSEFFEVLSKLDVSSQRVYDIVQAHFQTRELKDLSVQIQHQYGRVYLDVITSLPEELSVVILSLLDDRSLCRSAGVSSKWHALLQKQPMWRWFCHRRGWGIAFTYSPSMNWKRLYGSLTKGAQKRTKLIETEFLQYLSGSVGISAYKKAAGFLKKVPEYSALEKSIAMTLPQMEVITRLELVNVLFNHIENVFSSYLSTGDGSSKPDGSTAEEVDRTSSLRHRRAIISAKSQNGVVFPPTALHELVLERAYRLACLPPAIARLRRVMQHGHARTPTLNVLLDLIVPVVPAPRPEKISIPILDRPERSIYFTLAQFVQLIFQYHESKHIGVDVQFYVRFQTSLTFVRTKVHARLDDAIEAQKRVTAEAMYSAALQTLFMRLPMQSRRKWRALMDSKLGRRKLRCTSAIDSVKLSNKALDDVPDFIDGMSLLRELWGRENFVLFVVDPWSLAIPEVNKYAANPDVCALFATGRRFMEELTEGLQQRKCIIVRNVETPGHLNIVDLLSRSSYRKRSLPFVLVHIPVELIPNLHTSWTQVIDFRPDPPALRAFIFDQIIHAEQPDFHMKKIDHQNILSQLHASTESAADQIVSRLRESGVSEDLMLDVIHLRRKYRALSTQKHVFDAFVSEAAPGYENFGSMADFGSSLWFEVQQLSEHNAMPRLPTMIFRHYLSASHEEARNDVERAESLRIFVEGLIRRTGTWAAQCTQSDLKYIVMGTLRLLYLREIGYVKVDQYNAMKEVFRVVLLRTGTEQISVRESLATVLGDAKALVENADAKSFQKLSQRLTDVQVLAARLTRFSHQAFEAMAEFVSKEPCALRSHYVQLADLPDLQHQAVKLVVSSASQRTIQEITKLYAGVEGGKKVIPVITDADKRDFQWRQKLEYAKQTGEWLIIIMDEFYVVRFETLVASKVKAATDFILWLVCPVHLANRIPLWIDVHCQIIRQPIPTEPRAVANTLWSSVPAPSPSILLPTLQLIVFETMAIFDQLSKSAGVLMPLFDETDFEMGLHLIDLLSKGRIPYASQERALRSFLFTSTYRQSGSVSGPHGELIDSEICLLAQLMAESSQDLFRFVQETENESGGATQLSIQTYFERLEGFRVLKEKSDAYAASRLRVAPTDVVAKEQMETSDGRSENGEIVQTLRSLDEIGLLRTSTEDRRQHAFDFERACWLNHWLEMLASIESEALEHETGNRIRQNLSLLANSFHFLRRWLACGWPKEVTAGAPMNMESFLNMILLSVVEAGTCHQSRITFSSVQPIQKAALVWTDVKLLNGSYDVVKGIVQTGMGLSSTIHELWLDIQNVGNGVKNPRPTQPSETIFQCVCKVRHPLNPASEKFNLQLPSVVPRNQLIWSLVQAECANPDLGDTIVPVSEKLKTLDSRTVQHITAYLTFSPDTLHERHIIMRDVMPSLQASFTEEGILLHAVELYSYKGQTVEYEKHLLAAKSQLCRSDVYVAIVGNQLGEMLKNSAGKGGGKYSLDDEISMVLPKDESSVAPSELSSISSLRACYFLFRDPTFSRSVPKSHRHRYESRSHTESRLLAELRARITQKTETTDLFEVLLDYPCFFSRIEGGEIRVGGLDRISTQLTAWLRNGVHRIVEERVQKVRGKDEDLQFGAGESHLTGPVRYLDEIRSAFDGQEKSFSSCVLLDGPAGAGKTAVAKAVGRSYCDNGYLVMANFVGTWLGSDSSVRMLQRFSEDIMHAIRGAVEEMVGDNTEVIKRRFWSLMDEAVTRGFKLLFIIDEVDCIDRAGPAEEVSWLPPLEKLSAQVWRNTRWLCTATDASTLLPVFKLKYQNITTIRLTDLTDAHRDTYLQSIHPPLDMKLIQQVRSNPFSNRALLLHLVSKDASLLPASSQSTHDLSTTAIFQPLLDRLEASQPKVSPSALQLLALSPTGLVESEWSHLTNVPAIEWNLFFTDVLPYLSTTEGNRYVTFHEVFGEAIRERYIANTGDEKKVHRVLAEGFLALETKYNPNGFGFGGICTMRTSDILHHLFKAEASVKEILPVLCSLHNLQMVFETGVDASMRILEDFARLETILEKNSAAELGVAGTDRDVMVRKIREYKAFVRWCGRWARKETRLVGSLAWNFGCGMGGFVKGEVDEARMKLTKRDGGSGGQREKNGSWKGGAPVVGGSEDRNAKSMTWKRPAPSTKNLFGGKSASNPFPIIERVELSDLTSVPKVPFAFTPLSPQFENPCPIIALLPYTIHTSPQPPHRVVLSVSSSGSVHMYDLNTYTYIKTLAPNPLLPNHVRKCCLTARGNVVCGMKDRGLCLIILGFDNAVSLEDSGWAVRIAEEWWEGEDLVWEGGGVWTTKDKEGKGLKWIPVVEEGDFALETQDLNSKQKEYLNGICDDVVTVSDDGSKVVIVSGHWNALVVLGVGGYASGGTHGSSYSGLKELQRFQIPAEAMKDMEFGVGAFSLRKNLLAVTIIENRNEKTSSTQSLTSTAAFTSITVTTYNIDTHARHSLIKIPSGVEPPSSIGFSLDETRLYIGFGNGSISVADIQKGHIINKFRIGQGPVHKILISSWKGEERVFLGVGPEVVTCELKHSENEAGKIEDVGVVHGGRILDIQVMGRSSDGPLSFVSSCSEGVVIHSTKEDMRAPVVVRSTRESRGVTFLHHSKTLDLMVGAIGSDVVVWDLTEKVEHVPQSFREVARHTTSPYTFTRKVYIYPHPTLKHKLCLLVWAWDGMLSLWMISRRVDTGKGSEENVSGRSSTTGGSGYGNYVVEPSAVWEELAMVLADPPVVLEQNSDAGHGQHLRVLLARDDVGMVLDGVSGRKVREFWTKDGEDIVRLKWGRSTGGKAPVFWCGRATLYEDGEVLSDDVAWPISGELDLSIQGCLPDPMGRYIAYHGRYRKKIFERTTSDTVVVLPTLAIWPKRNDGTSSALPGNPPLDPTDFALHLPHYQKEITNYGFSSDGRYVITVASDFFLRIWNTDRVSSKNPSRSVHSSYRHPQLHALYPLQTTAMPASMTIIPSDPAGNVSVLVGDVEGRIVLYRVI